jgi:hypothetical protein
LETVCGTALLGPEPLPPIEMWVLVVEDEPDEDEPVVGLVTEMVPWPPTGPDGADCAGAVYAGAGS